MKTLVVYYSRTGNAKFMAETIAAELGSDLEEVIDLRNRQGKLAFRLAGMPCVEERLRLLRQREAQPNVT